MKYITILIVVVALLSTPTTAQASCAGFIDCLFGWTNRTEVREAEATERARIEAAAAADVARIQGEAEARIRQAEAEVERVRQLRYQSEAGRDIAIAQAQAQAAQYQAMIAGLTSEKIAGIQSNADTQIATLQESAKIAIAGIVQTGQTERWRVAFGWATVIVVVIALVIGWYNWLRRTPTVMVLPEQPTARRLPWSDEYDRIEIVEVRHANAVTRKH